MNDNVIEIFRRSWQCPCGGRLFKLAKHRDDPDTILHLICQDCESEIEGISILTDKSEWDTKLLDAINLRTRVEALQSEVERLRAEKARLQNSYGRLKGHLETIAQDACYEARSFAKIVLQNEQPEMGLYDTPQPTDTGDEG